MSQVAGHNGRPERPAIDTQTFHAVIRGERQGCAPGLARGLLAGASVLFGVGANLRRIAYDVGLLPVSRAGVPVVSVGNLTAGGTGKTPVVELLARTLRDRGRQVAVLSRGYKSRKLDRLQDWTLAFESRYAKDKINRTSS